MLARQNEHEVFIKIGLSIDLELRFKTIPYNHKIIAKGVMDISKAWLLESNCLSLLYCKGTPYKPEKDFGGKTECFRTSAVILLKRPLSRAGIYW